METNTTSIAIELTLELSYEERNSFQSTLADILDINHLHIPSVDDGERYVRFIEGCS